MILISGSWGRISGRKTSVAGHAPTTRHFHDKPKEKDVHVLLHKGTFIKINNQNNQKNLIIIKEIWGRLLHWQNSNRRNEIGVLMYHWKFNKRPLFLFYSSTFPVGNLVQKVDGYGILQDNRTKTQSYGLLNQKQKNHAVTRIRTWVSSATTRGTNHCTITAIER